MANRTDVDAAAIRGTNPQNLVEKIIRSKIHESMFWKQYCFALNAETIVDQTMVLKAVGGTYGGARMPSQFLCLVLKLLQIQPDAEVIREYILQDQSKYLRLLGAFYLRLTAKADQVYRYIEPLYNDLRKVRQLRSDGGYELTYLDVVAEDMIYKDYLFDIALPRLPKRNELEDLGMIGPRISGLDKVNIAKMEAARAEEHAEAQKRQQAVAEVGKREEQAKQSGAATDAADHTGGGDDSADRERDGGYRDSRRNGEKEQERDGGGGLQFKDRDRVRDTDRERRRGDRGDERNGDGGYRAIGRSYRDDDEDEDQRRGGYRDRHRDNDRDDHFYSRLRGERGERERERGGYRDRDSRDERERSGYRRSDRDYERDGDRDRDRERGAGRYARDRDGGDCGRERGDRGRGYRDDDCDRGEYRREARERGMDRDRDRDDGRSQAEKDRSEKKRGGGKCGKKDGAKEMSVEETNTLRAELGLPPLK